jgi:hypothetical protein
VGIRSKEGGLVFVHHCKNLEIVICEDKLDFDSNTLLLDTLKSLSSSENIPSPSASPCCASLYSTISDFLRIKLTFSYCPWRKGKEIGQEMYNLHCKGSLIFVH